MGNENSSGRIWIEGRVIHYEWPNGCWQLLVSDLKVMGEHTNDHGPYVDDYFFVFLTDSHYYEASFYAKGSDKFLAELSDLIGARVSGGLCHSTDFQSRVMWPPDIEGSPFYEFEPMPKPKDVWTGLKHQLLPEVAYHFADVVKGKLKADNDFG